MKSLLASALLLAQPIFAIFDDPSLSQQQQRLALGDDDMEGKKNLDDIIAESPLLSLHRSLCEIASISNSEGAVGDFLIEYLGARNFTVEKQPVPLDGKKEVEGGDETRFNIYAYPSGSPKPEIILTSHIDTVPPYIPYSVHAPSDFDDVSGRGAIRIAGRGTVDAKASVASMVTATLSHLSAHPDTPLGLLFVVSEETGGQGMVHFSKSPLNTSPPTFHTVIFGEPTELKLVSGHKGNMHFGIEAKGQAAHSGYPWLGRSAISQILPVLQEIDGLGELPESEGGLPASEKYGKTTVNIGSMSGGVAGNVVPASASASVTVRLAGGSVPKAREIISKAVQYSSHGNPNITISYGSKDGYAPVDLDTDVPGFDVMTVNYGTDVPNLKLHNNTDVNGRPVKRYLYGPGSIFVAHGDDEAITVRELEDAVDGYGRLINAVVRRGQPGYEEHARPSPRPVF